MRRRPRLSYEERLEMLRLIKERKRFENRRARLYNHIFRKGWFFRTVWGVRIVFMLCCLIVPFFHLKTVSVTEEIVVEARSEVYTGHTKWGRYTNTDLWFTTNQASYSTTIKGNVGTVLEKGDRIIVERNPFGRPIYFSKAEWSVKYGMDFPLFFYYIVFFMTFISLFFNDGTSRFNLRILWIIGVVDVIALLGYFLGMV